MVENIDLKSRFDFFRKNNIVYLDNAATTQVPDMVINSVDQILEYRGNPHRGAHIVAEKNGRALIEARENIARFISANAEEIVFSGNTTDSINLAIDSISHLIEKGDEIIISYSEHHSNILPFEKLTRNGAKIKVIGLNKEFKVDLEELKKAITKKTRIISLNHISNVLGVINPIEEIGEYLKKNYPKIIFIVDGAQAIAHVPVDVKKIKCDVYAFSSHKMYGPCGVGVLYLNKNIFPSLKSSRAGGGTVKHVSFVKSGKFTDLVVDFNQGLIFLEGGTPNTSNIIGLSRATSFIRSLGFDYIIKHEKELLEKLTDGLKKIDGIKIFGPENVKDKSGLISFAFTNVSTKEIGEYLDKKNICIRHGSHCAFPLIDYLGSETVRASIGVYNDESDIDTLLQEIQFFMDKRNGKIVNKNLEPLKDNLYYKQLITVNSREQILDKIRSMISNSPDTEVVLMAGHFLGIPDMQEDKFWPGIKQMLPERLYPLLEGFGMTSFPIFTWELGCEIASTLKKEGFNVKIATIVNDTTGINELRLSPTNTKNKKAEDYEKELIAQFKQPKIPKGYLDILKKYSLKEEDIFESSIDNKEEKFFNEKGLRGRFKEFVSKNKEYFDGVIDYVPLKDGTWELSIRILDNQEIKTCRFDTFGSKTGGKFCIVEVCEFISELFGKAQNVKFNYTSERVLNPCSKARNKVLVMLTPAMCDDAVSRGAELYIKLMLQERGEGSFKYLNVPLGPNSAKYLATGATLKYLSDKWLSEEISIESEPDLPELWKLCEYKLLYDADEYTNEIEELFKNVGINKKSKILDTCVGPGFFCTELLEKGYNLTTVDKDKGMVKPFVDSLKEKGIKHNVEMSTWLDLPKHFKKGSFDMLFNRGNTFIYGAGGWIEKIKVDKKKSLEKLKKTLQVYYDLLKKDGYLYIDKFKDSEVPSKKVVARLNIKSNNTKKDVVFYVERKPEEGTRYASMLLRDMKGNESGSLGMAYDLSEDEMEDLLRSVGFRDVKKIKLKNEKHFVVWLAKK